MDVNENKICKGPKFPFNYAKNMEINKPSETFYAERNETFPNKTKINFKFEDEENKTNDNYDTPETIVNFNRLTIEKWHKPNNIHINLESQNSEKENNKEGVVPLAAKHTKH